MYIDFKFKKMIARCCYSTFPYSNAGFLREGGGGEGDRSMQNFRMEYEKFLSGGFVFSSSSPSSSFVSVFATFRRNLRFQTYLYPWHLTSYDRIPTFRTIRPVFHFFSPSLVGWNLTISPFFKRSSSLLPRL